MTEGVSYTIEKHLLNRISELEETIRQLREPTPVSALFPREWKLTVRERDLLAILYSTRRKYIHRHELMDALYGDDRDEVHEHIVCVWVSKTRKKLKLFGMTIESKWGLGYFLPEETKQIIRDAIARKAEGSS